MRLPSKSSPPRSTTVKVAIGLCLLAPWGALTATETTLREGWNALATAAPRRARDVFRQHPGSPMARLGEAVALSQIPPTTRDTLAKVRRMLQEVVTSNDPAAAHAAKFQLGRLAQLDPFAPDPAAAAGHYEELVASGIDDEWTRQARAKLALLYLVGLPDGGGLSARLVRADALLAGTRAPAARRDLHLIIAEVRLYNGLRDATTLAHLDAAAATGGLDEMMQTDLLIQRARLSVRLERREDARVLYREFLKTYPRDNRHYTVAATLRELEPKP